MNQNVQKLKGWFQELSASDQEAVLQFLYGKYFVKKEVTIEFKKGHYAGPAPGLLNINEGLYVGPAPAAAAVAKCQTCGKPL